MLCYNHLAHFVNAEVEGQVVPRDYDHIGTKSPSRVSVRVFFVSRSEILKNFRHFMLSPAINLFEDS